MARTAVFSACLGLIFVWNWARIEEPRASIGPMLLMVLLGTAPALLPTFRWRHRRRRESPSSSRARSRSTCRGPGRSEGSPCRAGRGFLDFYDVLVPFDAVAHPLMHGVLLLAVFLFTALAALAVAARRPLLASLVLVAGAGWPATILPGNDDLGRGAFVLAAVLALVAWLRPEARRAPPQILVGIGIVIVALARLELGRGREGPVRRLAELGLLQQAREAAERRVRLGRELRRHQLPEGADDVSSRSGRRQRSRLLARDDARRVHGRPLARRPLHALLEVQPNPVQLTDDPLLPASARDPSGWTRADVTVDALRDAHLVGPSQPVQYDTQGIDAVQYAVGGVALAFRPLARGAEYTVWGYTPQPTPARARQSPADYPPEIALDRQYLRLASTASLSRRSARPSTRSGRALLRGHRRRRSATARSTTSPVASPGRRRTRTRPRSRSRPGSARPAGSSTTSIRRARAAAAAARQLRDDDEARLLPALRRRDGADAPLSRDSRAGGRRLLERHLRRGAEAVDGLRPRRPHLGRGLVQRLRLAAVRSDARAGARSRGRTRPRRRGSTRPERPECSSTSAIGRRVEPSGCFGSSSELSDARR